MKRGQKTATTSVTDLLQLSNRMDVWILCSGLVLLLYAFLSITNKLRMKQTLSYKLQKMFTAIQWITIGLLLQYLSNLLSITLYKAESSSPPFETFQELQTAVAAGKLTLLTEPHEMLQYLNVSKSHVKHVKSIEKAKQLMMQNPSLNVFVLI